MNGEIRADRCRDAQIFSLVLGGDTLAAPHARGKMMFKGIPGRNEESRQWIWVFRALWSAAPKLADVVGQHHSRFRRTRCHLHLLVPDTVLFQHGEPCKWVGSSPHGIVVRKPSLQAWSEGSTSSNAAGAGDVPSSELRRHAAKRHTSSSSRGMDEIELFERLDIIIAAFLDFAASGGSSSSSYDVQSDVPVCVARYNDGTSELLSGESLKKLCRFFNWRASLCALQAYVRPVQGATPMAPKAIGTYSRQRERRTTSTHHGRPQRSNQDNDGSRVAPGSVPASSATAATSDLQQAESSPAVTADDDSSSSTSFQTLTTALHQATEDVAFVTDLSYAWPAEASRATPRTEHVNAVSPSNSSSPAAVSSLGEKQDIATVGDRNLADSRMAVVVGGSVGQLQRQRPPWPKSRVRVSHLEAEFVIDQTGRPWFTNAPKVWLFDLKSSHVCGR